MCLCRVQRFVRRILGTLATSTTAQRYAVGSSKRPEATPTLAALAAGLDQHVQAVCKQVSPHQRCLMAAFIPASSAAWKPVSQCPSLSSI